MTEHERFSKWDAAYVLGALSPADRRAYEEHVQSCDQCRAAISDLAPMTGLLGKLSSDRAFGLLDEPHAGATITPLPERLRDDVLGEGRRHLRARRRTRWIVAAAAAIAVVLIVSAGVLATRLAAPASVPFAMESVADVPLEAEVVLDEKGWGTGIRLACEYTGDDATDVPPGGWPYSLVVIADDGTASQVSTWRALPGTTATLDAATALDVSDIASIEIRSVNTGKVLMRTELD
jgi:hypothetical protein